jgi:hypothetical protein
MKEPSFKDVFHVCWMATLLMLLGMWQGWYPDNVLPHVQEVQDAPWKAFFLHAESSTLGEWRSPTLALSKIPLWPILWWSSPVDAPTVMFVLQAIGLSVWATWATQKEHGRLWKLILIAMASAPAMLAVTLLTWTFVWVGAAYWATLKIDQSESRVSVHGWVALSVLAFFSPVYFVLWVVMLVRYLNRGNKRVWWRTRVLGAAILCGWILAQLWRLEESWILLQRIVGHVYQSKGQFGFSVCWVLLGAGLGWCRWKDGRDRTDAMLLGFVVVTVLVFSVPFSLGLGSWPLSGIHKVSLGSMAYAMWCIRGEFGKGKAAALWIWCACPFLIWSVQGYGVTQPMSWKSVKPYAEEVQAHGGGFVVRFSGANGMDEGESYRWKKTEVERCWHLNQGVSVLIDKKCEYGASQRRTKSGGHL